MEIRPVGAELFRLGKRTDGHEEAFRNFASAPARRSALSVQFIDKRPLFVNVTSSGTYSYHCLLNG
jgi:hypothetical protein